MMGGVPDVVDIKLWGALSRGDLSPMWGFWFSTGLILLNSKGKLHFLGARSLQFRFVTSGGRDLKPTMCTCGLTGHQNLGQRIFGFLASFLPEFLPHSSVFVHNFLTVQARVAAIFIHQCPHCLLLCPLCHQAKTLKNGNSCCITPLLKMWTLYQKSTCFLPTLMFLSFL